MAECRFLLDTNICIYILEGASAPARRAVEERVPGEVATSAICYAEMMRGLDPADALAAEKVRGLLRAVKLLDFDREAAEAFAHIPFRRHRLDRLIAAHALSRGLTLVTNNTADFADIPGLAVENWAP